MNGPPPEVPDGQQRRGGPLEVLATFTRLGLTSFGGPIAHLGYFHGELVKRRRWMDEQGYADLVALCQFLPGPASSQVAIGMGIARAGPLGGLAAWLGFTLPSVIALVAFALGVAAIGDISGAGWLRGLKIVAVPVVAYAVWGMAVKLSPDRPRATVAILAAAASLAVPSKLGQLLIILAGGLIGWLLLARESVPLQESARYRLPRAGGAVLLAAFFALLLLLPAAREAVGSRSLAVFDSFFRTGSLVFGGGHVVLPLLQAEVVPPGWLDNETFIAGYGASQAVPGPLFSFAAYLGAAMAPGTRGLWLALVALLGIYLPSVLLVVGVLPFWDRLRSLAWAQAALRGVNAAVVGILLAALYDPVWTSAISSGADLALALLGFLALVFWRWPPWLVVLATAAGAAVYTWLA